MRCQVPYLNGLYACTPGTGVAALADGREGLNCWGIRNRLRKEWETKSNAAMETSESAQRSKIHSQNQQMKK